MRTRLERTHKRRAVRVHVSAHVLAPRTRAGSAARGAGGTDQLPVLQPTLDFTVLFECARHGARFLPVGGGGCTAGTCGEQQGGRNYLGRSVAPAVPPACEHELSVCVCESLHAA